MFYKYSVILRVLLLQCTKFKNDYISFVKAIIIIIFPQTLFLVLNFDLVCQTSFL